MNATTTKSYPEGSIHWAVREHYTKPRDPRYQGSCHDPRYLQAVLKKGIVITQVWVEWAGGIRMEQWEHHYQKPGSLPFMHCGAWEYSDPARARLAWREFVSQGAVRIIPEPEAEQTTLNEKENA